MTAVLVITLSAILVGAIKCAPVLEDSHVTLLQAVLASDDVSLARELLDDASSSSRHKRGAAEDMFTLINGIFMRADRDGNHQLEIDEYWGTFKAFDLNEDGEITENEYVRFMTSGRFPAMNMLGDRRNVAKVAKRMFRTGDMNRNGVLDRDDAAIIFNNLDKDGDDHISEIEYGGRWRTILVRIGLLG